MKKSKFENIKKLFSMRSTPVLFYETRTRIAGCSESSTVYLECSKKNYKICSFFPSN